MARSTLRNWSLVHKWSSLVCTAFLLMLCVTGLPLVFHDEIDRLTGKRIALAGPPSSSQAAGLQPLDDLVARAVATRAGDVPLFIGFADDSPLITVTTGPRSDASEDEMVLHLFDRTTGLPAAASEGEADDVMSVLLELHTSMFAELPGMLFLGAMGALFVVALVSGTVLYAPFMRKLDFGTLRLERGGRAKWLDWHNLLGIVALAWMTVVGLTGVINALATPILKAWQADSLTAMTRAYAGQPALPPSRYGSVDRAMAAARARRPGSVPQFIGFPGGGYSSAHHYAIFLQGDTPLTKRLLTPALVDAVTGRLTDIRAMPWYVQALQMSQPLHFGDYGGLPMKLLWTVFDLFTIAVLGSGMYLWLRRRRVRQANIS